MTADQLDESAQVQMTHEETYDDSDNVIEHVGISATIPVELWDKAKSANTRARVLVNWLESKR